MRVEVSRVGVEGPYLCIPTSQEWVSVLKDCVIKLAVIIKGILETEASYLLLPSRFWISEQAVPVVDASRCEEGRWASKRDHLRRNCLCHCCIAVPNMRNVVPRVEEPSTSLIDQELPLPFNNEQRLGIFVRDGFCPRCDAAQCAHALVSESL